MFMISSEASVIKEIYLRGSKKHCGLFPAVNNDSDS